MSIRHVFALLVCVLLLSSSMGRLTDEEWKAMLADGTAPEPAPWAQDFMP